MANITNADIKIYNLIHPEFDRDSLLWAKYRLTYEGGEQFLRTYLKQFSRREELRDFKERLLISYSPTFGKAAINDIINSICQRFIDIIRVGGAPSYINSIDGTKGGVDLQGTSMDSFMGTRVLPELLPIGKVGIFIDMPDDFGPTLADKGDARPYLYLYKAEQIRAWTYDVRKPDRLLSVLLEDNHYIYDEKTGLTTGSDVLYRHLWIDRSSGLVHAQFYDSIGNVSGSEEPIVLDMPEIPFVILKLPRSLLVDVCDYQIALLNLESSDIAYILKSNFPFYTEQYDPRSDSPYTKAPGHTSQIVMEDFASQIVTQDNVQEVRVGATSGRRYPVGTDRPGFINPSSEPLKASMDKEDQIKRDIRLLINLTVANLVPRETSKASKNYDKSSLEAGLTWIGLVLEYAERRIAQFWNYYENYKGITTVKYPETYNLRTEDDRQNEAERLEKLISKVPSKTYQKELAKNIAETILGHKVSVVTLEKIYSEIDNADVIISDPDIIKKDFENGFVGTELASKIRGYPPGEVRKAEIDHANRIARIAISQSQGAAKEPVALGNGGPRPGNGQPGNGQPDNAKARGVPDLGGNPNSGKEEKKVSRDTTFDAVPTDKTRGSAQ